MDRQLYTPRLEQHYSTPLPAIGERALAYVDCALHMQSVALHDERCGGLCT